ncbi:hypothetical protein EXU57_03785 [Segetibacter sp. 3557_3]|uniref:hypothetical protein n=1 Tax=Segetibacter sp. 3557_3 TaxID=2547429 RepID=UPI0010589719|nr:hypothetical protein [Segetibacter sp. 3557_3]TDH29200.1 hypothetical protein EXU57_03785 [Segetibacter sp. 3557_3]
MQITDVAVATITWARDHEEEQLLRDALTQLAAHNIPVFICDGGSPQAFIDFLNGFENFTVVESKVRGLWGQVHTSLKAASQSGRTFIFYTEPDKEAFFRESLAGFLMDASPDAHTGIVLASRSAGAFSTFPEFQQKTETTINFCCTEVIKQELDYTYGPFLLTRELIPYFSRLPDSIGWGWRPFAFVLAHKLGFKVRSQPGEFNCPEPQRSDDASERLYRMRQLAQNIEGVLEAASFQLKPGNSAGE